MTKEEILAKNGFDFDVFQLDNEYSAKNILLSMQEHTDIEVERIKNRMYRRGFEIPWIDDIVHDDHKHGSVFSDQEKHKWNDVRISLPDNDRDVLVIGRKFGFAQNRTETDEHVILYYLDKKWMNSLDKDYEDNSDYYYVVYWMELPQRPEA